MQNSGQRGLADNGSLQLPRQFGVNYGAGSACVQEKTEGAGAIHCSLNDNQVSIAQSKPDDLSCLFHLRGKRAGKSNQKSEKKESTDGSTSAGGTTSAREATSIQATTSVRQQAGRQHHDLPIGFALNSLERSLSPECTSCHGTLSTGRNLTAPCSGFCAVDRSFILQVSGVPWLFGLS